MINPIKISSDQMKSLLLLLAGDENGEGGIETLVVDVGADWSSFLSDVFPPATKAWKNLRKIHFMQARNPDHLMSHLYMNG